MNPLRLTRRRVLALAGGLWAAWAARAAPGQPWQALAVLLLRPDGGAELTVRRVEMGQGAHAGLLAVASDELGLPADRWQLRQADAQPRWGPQLTGGSYTAAGAERALRPLVAGVRQRLEQAAAARWGVDAAQCHATGGQVVHAASGRALAFAALLAEAAALPEPAAAAQRPRRHVEPGPRPGMPHAAAVSRGAARYGIDQLVPGQLHAVLARAPSLNARLRRFDARPCKAVAGFVRAVALPGNRFPALNHVRDSVALVARDSWAAQRARELLQVEWDEAPDSLALDDGRIARELSAAVPWPEGEAWRWELALPAYPHLPMEPPNAWAQPQPDGGLRIVTGTQRLTRLADALAQTHGLARERIAIDVPLLGGGFGRRLEVDYALEAAALALALNAPVKLLWTREDDIAFGLYRPPSLHRITARLSPAGRITHWQHRCASVSVMHQQEPAEFALDPADWTLRMPMLAFPYDVADVQHRPAAVDLPLPVAWWRGTGWTQVGVAVEAALNGLAAAAGHDPIALRLAHLPPGRAPLHVQHAGRVDMRMDTQRLRRVLERVAARAGWPRAHAAPACGFYDCDATYVAVIAQADPARRRIETLWISVDCGRVLTPDVVRQQIESAVAFALSAHHGGGVHWRGGRVLQRSLAELPLLSLADWPEVHVDLVDSDDPVSGIGEPVVPPLLAAIRSALQPAP
jgi:isoquinoline 1-oxidoreductase subunit beta